MITKTITYCITLVLTFSLLTPGLYAENQDQINLNAATVEELAKVPGLNHELAESIIEARDENGEFVDMEELLDVDGVDVTLLRRLKKHLMIEELDGCNC